MKTMDYDTFTKLFKLCRSYDPFTMYIDSYRQELQAEKANENIVKKIFNILEEYEIQTNIIPYGTTVDVSTEEALINLKQWLRDKNVMVLEKERRIWKQDEIKQLILINDKMVYRSLQVLYSFQTADEKSYKDTTERNGKGFNSVDAEFMSSCANFYQKNGYLTNRQKEIVRKKLIKYTRQLTDFANK